MLGNHTLFSTSYLTSSLGQMRNFLSVPEQKPLKTLQAPHLTDSSGLTQGRGCCWTVQSINHRSAHSSSKHRLTYDQVDGKAAQPGGLLAGGHLARSCGQEMGKPPQLDFKEWYIFTWSFNKKHKSKLASKTLFTAGTHNQRSGAGLWTDCMKAKMMKLLTQDW